jgi:Fur family ferric uptake transcriptional regulator
VTKEDFIDEFKKQKKRITPIRLEMFEKIRTYPSPVSADKLVKLIGVNKTTIYRDLNLFLAYKIISEVDFSDGTIRYELTDLKHHHHLICLKCKRVQDISFEENLEWEENKIKNSRRFQVVRHNLEFFGYCQNCTQ